MQNMGLSLKFLSSAAIRCRGKKFHQTVFESDPEGRSQVSAGHADLGAMRQSFAWTLLFTLVALGIGQSRPARLWKIASELGVG
jgi:hypothetical protein